MTKNVPLKPGRTETKVVKIEIQSYVYSVDPSPASYIKGKYLEQEVIVVPCSSQVEYNVAFTFPIMVFTPRALTDDTALGLWSLGSFPSPICIL